MFKESFKYYKRKNPPPDLSEVISIDYPENENLELLTVQSSDGQLPPLGIKPPSLWKIYRIKSKPGLIFIENPFTSLGQRYWIMKCLQDYTQRPQKLNIDPHNYIKETDDWWTICNENEKADEALLKKLRWSTLGYHHNWDTKIYSESSKDVFPADLAELSQCVADAVGFKGFSAEAAIVNFYHMDSTLSGHTDHSEENLEAPLLSFSFGQSAIFLIGGATEDCPGVPIFIHSGDIVIMSKESRLSYHAVPRITPSPTQPWDEEDDKQFAHINNFELCKQCKNEVFWKPFHNYIQKSRINLNVRQVLQKGQSKLNR